MAICNRCGKDHDGSFGSGKYCSRGCANKREHSREIYEKVSKSLSGRSILKNGVAHNRKQRVTINPVCIVCKKTFSIEVVDSEPGRRNVRKTCSETCAYEFKSIQGRNSASVQSETRRSKNEKMFADLCTEYFRNVQCNKKMFNGWDADIVLDDVKIAILWNGKWHYEKITAKHSVEQVQNRDRIKMQEIEKAGYVPYVIKDMGSYDAAFVENQFRELVKWVSQVSHKD
jgi:hypothetical protein